MKTINRSLYHLIRCIAFAFCVNHNCLLTWVDKSHCACSGPSAEPPGPSNFHPIFHFYGSHGQPNSRLSCVITKNPSEVQMKQLPAALEHRASDPGVTEMIGRATCSWITEAVNPKRCMLTRPLIKISSQTLYLYRQVRWFSFTAVSQSISSLNVPCFQVKASKDKKMLMKTLVAG